MMRSRCLLGFVPVVIVVLLLAACGDTVDGFADTTLAVMTTETADTTVASTTTITLQETTTTLVAPTTTWVVDEVVPEAVAVGLAEPGEYGVGEREYTFVDPARHGREVVVSVHYPAVADGSFVVSDAEPNVSAAPYPVVVGSDQMANLMGPHLASHGFIVLGGVGQATWDDHPSWKMVDYPLDLMIGLDGLEDLDASDPLAGIAATDRAGVIDYSFGSWTALMLAGGRVNPAYYEATCASRPAEWTDGWFEYVCGSTGGWTEMVERGVKAGVASAEGLWEPMGDDRIKAAMPMGPEGFDLTGPDGLAGISIPVMYVAAGSDTLNSYPLAAVPLFDNTDPDWASMITFTDAGHMMIFDPDAQIQFKRFALAFFGYHLAGIDQYAPALTSEFVERQAPYLEPHSSYETLIWGVNE